MIKYKICKTCGKKKVFGMFHISQGYKDKKHPSCLICVNIARKSKVKIISGLAKPDRSKSIYVLKAIATAGKTTNING